ncbi:SDR family oxidoreductase [Candidatus Bipolaricaulota bacterium]
MKTALITGGSSGIGLEFTKQFLERGSRVIAASREALNAESLRSLQEEYGEERLLIRSLDVGDEESRRGFFSSLSEQIERIDYLVNSAGIVSGDEETRTAFGTLDQTELSRTFLINTIAPVMVVQDALSLMKNGVEPVVVNISSSNGSIAQRNVGGKYSYCASKAGLNMMTKILAADLREAGVIVVAFHPGWVKTRMTRNEPAPMEATESVSGMLHVLETIRPEDSGAFLDWQGNVMPW